MKQPRVSCLASLALPLALGALTAAAADTRPYEFVNAHRDRDEIAPWIDFERETGWSGVSTDGVVRVERSQAHQLFGAWTLAVTLNATEARVRPAAPLALPSADFTSFGVWIRGIRGQYGTLQPKYALLELVFTDGAGRETFVRALPTIWDSPKRLDWTEWHWLVKRFTPDELGRIRGLKFNGFRLLGGVNATDVTYHFDNVSFFRDDLSGKLDYELPDGKALGVPTRPEGACPESGVAGYVNTVETNGTHIVLTYSGPDGKLVYTWNRGGSYDWTPRDNTPFDLRAKWNDEREFFPMLDARTDGPGPAEWTVGIRGKTLILEVRADAGAVTNVQYGAPRLSTDARFTIPMYFGRRVTLTGTTFSHVFADWYVAQASVVRSGSVNIGNGWTDSSEYRPKTDGTYNPVYERIYLTVSPTLHEVLPTIANPPSPWKRVTGTRAWHAYASTADRARDRRLWRRIRDLGIRDVVINDHESCFRDAGESFTFRLDPAPGKGGAQGLKGWADFLIGDLGYYYGPYNNFTDFAPVNANWAIDRVSRESDGSFTRAWQRCYSPKPLYGLAKCREYAPILKARFGFNTAYCDVHTAYAPWDRTDYDARIPGAARYTTTFYAYAAILDCQRKAWGGPVYSEGNHHALYAGLSDGNYAQGRFDPECEPWIVDFNLRKIHPLECDFGMGNLQMFNGGRRPFGTEDSLLDHFIAAELAFGNAPYLAADFLWRPKSCHGPAYSAQSKLDFEAGAPLMMRSYFMPIALAKRYTQVEVDEIRYGDQAGRLETTSDALRSGAARRNQVLVRYKDGTCVVANGSLSDRLVTTWHGHRIDLPPTGYCGWTADGKVQVVSSDGGTGGRYDYAATDDFVFLDTRGAACALPRARGNGVGVRYREGNAWKTVVLRGEIVFSEEEVNPAAKEPVGETFDRYVNAGRIAGVVSVLSDKDYNVQYDCSGWADIEGTRPMTPDTVFAVFSMSKTFLGAAMMCAIDEGKISLDDPVSKFIPAFAKTRMADGSPLKRPLTVRDLTCHVSGLRKFQHCTDRNVPIREVARLMSEAPLQFQPGETFRYGNGWIDTAAHCIELATGESYESYLERKILAPLGMKDTTFFPTPCQIVRMVRPYTSDDKPLRPGRDDCTPQVEFPKAEKLHPSPAGGLFSTPRDMIRFSQMLAHHGEWKGTRIISRKTFDTLFAVKQTPAAIKEPYTCGSWLYGDWFGHEGAMRTDQRANLKTGHSRVFFIQTENAAGSAFFALKKDWHAACDRIQGTPPTEFGN